MNNKTRRNWAIAPCFALLALAGAPCLHAETPASVPAKTLAALSADKPSSREVVQQKLQLVKMMMTQSTAIDRATHSKDAAVKQKADNLLALYARAYNAFEEGDTAGAEKLLDEVMRNITEIARQVPDPHQIEADQRARYEELAESMRGIQVTYQEMRNNMSPDDKHLPALNANLKRIRNLVEQAQALAQQKRYQEASKLLENGYTTGVSDLNKLMGSEVTTYVFDFATPAAEFDHVMARYRSYEELVPIARAELKPGADSSKLSERYIQESRAARDSALKQAAGGNHKVAIITLHEAIRLLQTALRTIGLSVPD